MKYPWGSCIPERYVAHIAMDVAVQFFNIVVAPNDMSEELLQLETPHRASGHRTVVNRAVAYPLFPLMMHVEKAGFSVSVIFENMPIFIISFKFPISNHAPTAR